MTIPNEQWGADSGYDDLAGTTDADTGVPYPASTSSPTTSPTKGVVNRRMLSRIVSILKPLNQGRVVQESSTDIGVFALAYRLGGTAKSYDGVTGVDVTAAGNATYYIYLNSSNTLVYDQTSFPADENIYVPLAEVTVAGGAVTAVTDRRPLVLWQIGINDGAVSAAKLADAVADLIPQIDISVGAEGGNEIVVDIQVQDCQANSNANQFLLHAWLSDTQGGAETASTPSAGCTWGTGTVLEAITANERWTVITDATGAAQVTVGESGVDTWYLHVEIDGRIYISDAITFA